MSRSSPVRASRVRPDDVNARALLSGHWSSPWTNCCPPSKWRMLPQISPLAQRGGRSHAKRSDAARRPPLRLQQISLPPWTVPGGQPATRVHQVQPKNDKRGRRRRRNYPQLLRRREDAQHRFDRRAAEFAGERRAPPEPKPPPRNGRAHGALAKDMCAAGETLASARDQSTTCNTN